MHRRAPDSCSACYAFIRARLFRHCRRQRCYAGSHGLSQSRGVSRFRSMAMLAQAILAQPLKVDDLNSAVLDTYEARLRQNL
jgi:hypothetical protein